MIFRPRIFISSTLNENLSIREKLEVFFKSIGAEPMLYETNLTPSVVSSSYRTDILDADFIIFILKNQYGTPTPDTGLSGIHEEFQIALSTNIPKHVYVKKSPEESMTQSLKAEIDSHQISYYYFDKDPELLSRIKETSFTIAKEIMLKKVEDMALPKQSVRKISTQYDYSQAVEIIKALRVMRDFGQKYGCDYVTTTLFSDFLSPIANRKYIEDSLFIDQLLELKFNEMLNIYNSFVQNHCIDYTAIPGTNRTYNVPVLGQVVIYKCQANAHPQITYDEYYHFISQFFDAFSSFENYVSNMRINLDSSPF